jgi:prepilin-type N-terminal cleavage/methylation domain-containing protein
MKQRATESGFTLIEVLISILLASLLVIGAVALFRIESRAGSFSRRETEASVLAQDKLEALRTLIQPTATGTGADAAALDASGNTGTPQAIFTRDWAITQMTDGSNVYQIEVHVSWDDGEITRTVTVRGRR